MNELGAKLTFMGERAHACRQNVFFGDAATIGSTTTLGARFRVSTPTRDLDRAARFYEAAPIRNQFAAGTNMGAANSRPRSAIRKHPRMQRSKRNSAATSGTTVPSKA
jgi:hypothetical protein